MLLKHGLLVGLGVAIGVGFGALIPQVSAQGGQKPQTIAEFPDLVGGLKATPGCLSVKTTAFNGGKQPAIFAWFKNKAAVDAWYNSSMHRGAMKQFFPNLPGQAHSLSGFKDEKSPLLVVATITPSDKPGVAGSNLAISQIAIEIYTPVPGGIAFGGRVRAERDGRSRPLEDFRRRVNSMLVRKLAGYGVFSVSVGVVLWLGLRCIQSFFSLGPTTTDELGNWPKFYAHTVSQDFWIPLEAKILKAENTEEIIGHSYLVEFSLPAKRSTEEWLQLISARSNIDGCRKNKLMFDCKGDIHRLEYLPERGIYEVVWSW